MRIAVTYENGNVFQHFGRTENFKFYDVEDGKILSATVVSSNGAGHEGLAYFLAENNVNLVICGGLGGGAKAALADAGIIVFSGAEGNTDEAVEKFLAGELEQGGVNCDHHHEHGEGGCCGHHEHEEGGHCGHHDHGEGGGCCGHHRKPAFEGPNVGKAVRVHYTGTFNDGTKFDSSYDRGQTLNFTCGAGQMIPGFDKAVANMKVGEIIDIHLMPEEAYGMPNPNDILTIEIAQLPGSENLEVGQRVYLRNAMGQPIPVTVTAKDDVNITLDANSEMAGKELNFKIEMVEIED